MGQRLRKTTGSAMAQHFVYLPDGQLLGEYSGTTPVYEYVWLGDLLVAVLAGPSSSGAPQVFHVHSDHLNTPRVLIDQAAQTRWRWVGEPFGSHAAEPAPTGLPPVVFNLRFPGQYFDLESGLHYNYFRDYDAGSGRYVQSDPIGLAGGINTYAYVNGNPLSYVDPNGLQVAIPLPAPAAPALLNPWVALPAASGYLGWEVGSLLYPYIERPLGDAIDWCMNSESSRCQKVREKCIDYCTNKTLPTRDYGASFRKCLNRCMVDNDCKAPSAGGW